MDIQQNCDDIVVKNEQTESAPGINDCKVLKQEPLDPDSVETCHNVYDSLFEVVKHELCENSLGIKHSNHSNSGKQKPSQAIAGLSLGSSSFISTEPATFASNDGNKANSVKLEQYEPIDKCQQVFEIEIDAVPIETSYYNYDKRDERCVNTSNVYLEPALTKPEVVLEQDESLAEKQTTTHLFDYQATSQHELPSSGISTPEPSTTHTTDQNDSLINGCGNKVSLEYKVKHKKLLVRHIKSHTTEKLFTCNSCGYTCKHNSKLVVHMRIHSGEKPFVCTLCNAPFKQNSHLMRHMKKSHSEENPYCCKHCDYKCSQARYLRTHMKRHTDISTIGTASAVEEIRLDGKALNPVPASEECSLGTATPSNRPHTSLTKLQCKYCSYTTVYGASLRRHTLAHTGEKRFTCNVCDYKCAQAYPLKLHMRTHSEEGAFKCIYCNYKSIRPSDLKKHVRIHMGEKRFTCSVCQYTSTDRSVLGKHLYTHRK